jgi:hypothetical protein
LLYESAGSGENRVSLLDGNTAPALDIRPSDKAGARGESGAAMDKSFGKELFAGPCKKSDFPEDLICYFTRSNCFMVDYLQYDPATDSIKIDTSLFMLPFDNFLHSIKVFKPLRSHFLYDGPCLSG